MSHAKIYDQDNFESLEWDLYREGNKIKNYFVPFLKSKTNHYIRNVKTKIGIVAIDDLLIPFTVNEKDYENSYVCSPYNHYVTYAKEELVMLKKPVIEKILNGMIDGIGCVTKIIEINKVVYLNNWLLSTNLSVHLTEKQIQEIHQEIIKHYPSHLICYRSMNDCLYPNMLKDFQKNGYQKLPSRYVYISEPNVLEKAKKRIRNTLKRDEKLLQNPNIEIIQHEDFTEHDINRVRELYQQLYLDKYSYQNPQFTDDYIRETYQTNSLHYMGIRINGILEGVFASKIYQGMMANPIVGYNTSLPKEMGMYRMIRYLAVQESIRHGRMYHQSAGVGRYKHDRGAIGFPEYTMIYTRHLTQGKRMFWRVLCEILNRFAIKIVEKNRL